MESRRVVILVVAIVLGAVAALASFAWLGGIQDRANKGAALVQVYVAKKDIPKGMTGEKAISDKYIETSSVQAKFRPANAVISPDAIKGKVALVPLPANVTVIDGLFVDPRVAQVTNSQRIEPGRVLVSLSLDQVHAVGGLLVPGDKVNIMTGIKVPVPPGFTAEQKALLADEKQLEGLGLLYQNVEILFIGKVAAAQPGETSASETPDSGVITFSVPQVAAERIVFAAAKNEGGLYLTLVPPNNPAEPFPPVNELNVFGVPCTSSGPDAKPGTQDDVPTNCVPLTPYGPEAATTAPAG